jgi:hypothetical protein
MNHRLTPDGVRYLIMAQGRAQPMPFHLRALMPLICGTNETRWVAVNVVSVFTSAFLIGVLAVQMGATWMQAVLAAALFLVLPWVRFCWECPVLVDMPGLALALLAAVLAPINPLGCAVALAAAALTSEKAPIWAALFAWNPILLFGLMVPLCVNAMREPAAIDPLDRHAETLTHPLRTGLKYHRGVWLDPRVMLLPWGACLVAAINPSWQLAAVLVASYAQLFVATDTVRLYQQAAPIVCIAAATALPISFAFVAIVGAVALWNPWGRAQP